MAPAGGGDTTRKSSRVKRRTRRLGESQDWLNEPDVRDAAGLDPLDDVVEEEVREPPPGLLPHQADHDEEDSDDEFEVVVDRVVGEEEEEEENNDAGEGYGGEVEEAEGEGVQGADTQPQALPDGFELPSMDDLQTTTVTTLKWCPKAARGEFARELASVLNRIKAQPDRVGNWVLQAMFARCILPAGRGPRAGDAYSQARLVRERLRRWRAREFSQLWDEAVELTRVRPRQGRPRKRGRPGRRRQQQEEEESQAKKNAERATTLAQDGQYTKALQALTSAGMASHSRANIEVRERRLGRQIWWV